MKKFILLSTLLLLVGVGSSWAGSRPSAFAFPQGMLPIAQKQAAEYFSGCRELGSYLRDVMENGYYNGVVTFGAGDPQFSASPDVAQDSSTQLEYSETNVQEAGVDEADIIKTDGEYMYIANAGYFSIVRGYPPAQMELLYEHELSGDANGLFVKDDLVIVISSDWGWNVMNMGPALMPINSSRLTKVKLFDISDRTAPELMREIQLEGSFNTARMVNGAVHLVIDSQLHETYFSPPRPAYTTMDGAPSILASMAGPASINVDGLIPQMTDLIQQDGELISQVSPMAECDAFIVPPREEGSNMLTILTLDLANPLGDLQSTSILTDYATVYASAERLYVAAMTSQFWASVQGGSEKTRIHRFALGSKAELEAIGEVPGTIVNRYSLGESDGYLRVATTLDIWGWAGIDRMNTLYILGQSGDELEVVGELSGLGHEGERIYAVRFNGDRGYVVTFRQTDPLYTLDLSDPTNPRAVGELEVPGFSTYLHPVGENHLLGIGRNPDQGSTDISIYDVSDFANPRLVDRASLGSNSWSEALYEPKAFSYFQPANLLAIPINTYLVTTNILGGKESTFFNGVVVMKVDLETGFDLQGLVRHQDVGGDSYGYYPPDIRRSLFVGSQGEYLLYTLSNSALKVNDTNDLTSELAVQSLPVRDLQLYGQPL